MKRHYLLAWIAAAAALCAAPVSAQLDLLPAQETVPAPVATSLPADSFLNTLHQQEWVQLSADGSVSGHFVQLNADGVSQPVPGLSLLLTRNAAAVTTLRTDQDGRFVITGIGVGTYGLVGRSERSLAAFVLHVLPSGASTKLDSEFTVYGTTQFGPIFNDVLRAHTVPGGSAVYPDFRTDPLGDTRRFSEGSRVQLRANGVLTGRVSKANGFTGSDLSGNVVHILRNGSVVGHEATNGQGEFQIANLSGGVYDVIIAGKDGIAAGSFMALEPVGVVRASTPAGVRFVSTLASQNGGGADSLNVELIPSSDFYVGEVEVVPPADESGMFPIPGGGFAGPGGFPGGGGGGFGGGGGGGGIGGIGALLGIGGLAAGVAALAREDNGFNLPPASVIIP